MHRVVRGTWIMAVFLLLPAAASAQAGPPIAEWPEGAEEAEPPLAAAAPRATAPEAAPDTVVLSVGGDAPEEDARRAREAVAAALTEDGALVLDGSDLSLRIPPARLGGCRDGACAYSLGRELGVSLVAAVATWGASGASSITVSLVVGPDRSYAATETIAGGDLAAAARAAVAAAQAARRRALLIGGAMPSDPDAQPTDPSERPVVERRQRSLEEIVLPSVLGLVGLALLSTSIYALIDQQCDVRGGSGVCLRGSDPNFGLGVLFAVTGALSVAGAILWLAVGGNPTPMGPIEVVLGPDGGGVTARGHF